ncbi:MAG TPA: PIN domain-containing protein [Desulfuromonadales bacterium]|nr:PIN domain-containing protein [Desulfuromonadales bacterium]
MGSTDRVLPDTCAWIDFFNARRTPLAKALENLLVHGDVYTCGVVKYELVQGLRGKDEERTLLEALQAVTHKEMSETLWLDAGRLSAALRKKGVPLPFSDILIAAVALKNDLTVLTVDRHFDQIPRLRVLAE